MAAPENSDDQRVAAWTTATASRQARSAVKKRLKDGHVSVDEVLADAVGDDVIGRMRVSDLLESLPHMGKAKARVAMMELQIAPTRRLRGLGERQRAAVLARFGSTPAN